MPGSHTQTTQESPWTIELARWFHVAKTGKDVKALERAIMRTSPGIPAQVVQCFIRAVSSKTTDPVSSFERYLQNVPAAHKENHYMPVVSMVSEIRPNAKARSRSGIASAEVLKREKALEEQLTRQRRERMLGLDALDADDLDRIQWNRVTDVIHLAGGEGSMGVYLVDVGGKGTIVKPGSLSTAGEYFCSLLYKNAGMRVPRQRIILSRSDGEMEKLRAVVSRRADMVGASEGMLRLKIELDKASCVSVVEYIRSRPIWELSKASEVDRQRLLNQIGKTMALDMLVNNGDRLPLIHRGEGNPSNLLLTKHQEYTDLLDVCLIDNNINAILNPEGREKYLQLVSNVSKEISVGNLPPTKMHGMDAVARFLLIHADIQVDMDEAIAIMEGIQGGMREVVSLCTSDPTMFHRMKEETVRAFQRTPGAVPVLKPGVDAIDEEFLQLVQIRFL